MRRILLFVVSIFFTQLISINSVNADIVDETIRVGLVSGYANVEKIDIKNNGISIGYQIGNVYVESAKFLANSSFSISYDNSYYVRLPQTFYSFNEARDSANQYISQGYKAIPCNLDGDRWEVYLGGYSTEGQALEASTSLGGSIVNLNSKGVVLRDGSVNIALFHNENYYPQVRDIDGNALDIGAKKYRGRIEASRKGTSKITAVNVLEIDEYLYSVVPSEMPASWHIEALKAQTVASRNYTLTRRGIHSESGYDLCDSSHCQVYLGAGNEATSTTTAVSETSGKLIYHNGVIINAVYFSSSGGVTEDSENVWINNIPYLRGITEINEVGAKEWTRSFSISEINTILANNGINIGNTQNITINSLSPMGRVNELVISGTNGEKVLKKEEIRTFFSSSKGGSLESRNFVLGHSTSETTNTKLNVISSIAAANYELKNMYVISSNTNPQAISSGSQIYVVGDNTSSNYTVSTTITTNNDSATNSTADFVFQGRGWGHGVGFSQYGANGMANIGYTYEQILKHYYTGVEIK